MCPHCYEQVSLWESIKLAAWLKLPRTIHFRIEKHHEQSQLQKLKNLYSPKLQWTADILTPREHEVCVKRCIMSKSLEEVAQEWNVTRERIRQIEAKALRKLQRQFGSLKHNSTTESVE